MVELGFQSFCVRVGIELESETHLNDRIYFLFQCLFQIKVRGHLCVFRYRLYEFYFQFLNCSDCGIEKLAR